jgi:hypothetical protein
MMNGLSVVFRSILDHALEGFMGVAIFEHAAVHVLGDHCGHCANLGTEAFFAPALAQRERHYVDRYFFQFARAVPRPTDAQKATVT